MMVERLVNSEANARRIANVEGCFGTSGQPLYLPGRVLVGEGILIKQCRKGPKPRQFFLFNDIFVYGNILINKRKYNKQHIIPLEEVKIVNLEDGQDLRNGFQVKTRSKSFNVYAATATEKSEWMSHINRCLQDLISNSGKKPADAHAAVWIPDREVHKCMHCKMTQFNMIQRRHHCRKCGAVVCGGCSNKRFLLPEQSKTPLRVCCTCYDTLSRAKLGSGGLGDPAGPVGSGSGNAGTNGQHAAKSATNGAGAPGPGGDNESSGDDSSDDDEPVTHGHVTGGAGGDSTQGEDRQEPTFYGHGVEQSSAS